MITIIKPGSFANIGVIRVLILEVALDDALTTTYKVCWWDNMDRKTDWVSEKELNIEKDTQLDYIGFTI